MSTTAPGKRTLISGCIAIATMDDAGTEFSDSDILLNGRQIEAVGPAVAGALRRNPTVDETIDARSMVAVPGFVNTHHHLFQTLTRAIPAAQDKELFDWLVTLYQVWREMTPEGVHVSALVGLGELLLTGCTTSSDHFYLFPKSAPLDLLDQTIRAASELGIRFHPTRGSMSVGESDGGLPPDDCVQSESVIISDCERVISTWHDPDPFSMVRVGLAPCSPFSVSEGLMRDTAGLARQHGLRLHTHLAETLDEERYCIERFGLRPLDLMARLGWVGDDVWFAHGIHFNDHEIAHLGQTGTGVAHCPVSNLRLGSGTCRLLDLTKAGAPVGLGVDGSASNDSSNMWAEARAAMLVQRGAHGAAAISAREVLRVATRGGAKVLGRGDIGQLSAGKAADVVLYNVEELGFAGGMHDPIASLIFCGTTGRVHTSIVNGKVVVREGRLLGGEERDLFRRANALAAAQVAASRARSGMNALDPNGGKRAS
ncbi:MAG: 8-oxoguanine deaminase [Myxococcota bacterium]|jgi:8-oxoguanine deaminase